MRWEYIIISARWPIRTGQTLSTDILGDEMKKAIAFTLVLAGISAAGYAQEGSDLQAKGAKVLTKDEVAAVFKGATVQWTTPNGMNNQRKFAEDGSFVGNFINPSRTSSGTSVSGTWKITDDGKLCRSEVTRGQTDEYCWVVSKLGDKYYQGIKAPVELQVTR
jgi:ABC-type phosphate transport system substrate-binding protein